MTILLYGYIVLFMILLLSLFKRGGSVLNQFQDRPKQHVNHKCLNICKPNFK